MIHDGEAVAIILTDGICYHIEAGSLQWGPFKPGITDGWGVSFTCVDGYRYNAAASSVVAVRYEQ